MWYEALVGVVIGAATYLYLYYYNKKRERAALLERVAEEVAYNETHLRTDSETMEWLNFLIKQWYVYVADKLEDRIKEIAQPILDDINLPSFIKGVELETVSFGQNPPTIKSVRSQKEPWDDDENLQTLQIVLEPRVNSPEFEVKMHVKGIGTIVMEEFSFSGELMISILKDTDLPFPCIKYVYFTFNERPDIKFNLGYGSVGLDLIPNAQNYIEDIIEEVISDTLVNPGRFFIDMSGPEIKPFLVKGVRKLKRNVLHIQVDISTIAGQGKDEKREIKFYLNTGGRDHKGPSVKFYREKKTHHIWYPLAVLQEEINFKVYKDRVFAVDKLLLESQLDVSSLTNAKTRELSRNVDGSMLTVVSATLYKLPYIPIRQTKNEVIDHCRYFNIATLTRADVLACHSGLVYLHIHRATNLPIKDTRTSSSDPYVKVFVGGHELFKTKTIEQNLDPTFNHFEDFFVMNVLETTVKLTVYDNNAITSDDYIGAVKIQLGNVVPQIINGVFTIQTNRGAPAGMLYISLIFRPISFPPTNSDVTQFLADNIGAVTILE